MKQSTKTRVTKGGEVLESVSSPVKNETNKQITNVYEKQDKFIYQLEDGTEKEVGLPPSIESDVEGLKNNTINIKNSYGGFSAGDGANASGYPGVAIGRYARTNYGGAVGNESKTIWGGSIGNYANSYSGGAIGRNVKTYSGGAIGEDAYSGNGFSGGYSAKSDETPLYLKYASDISIDAIQLGTGENKKSQSLQIYDDNIYSAQSHTLDVQNGIFEKAGKVDSTFKTIVKKYDETLTIFDTSKSEIYLPNQNKVYTKCIICGCNNGKIILINAKDCTVAGEIQIPELANDNIISIGKYYCGTDTGKVAKFTTNSSGVVTTTAFDTGINKPIVAVSGGNFIQICYIDGTNVKIASVNDSGVLSILRTISLGFTPTKVFNTSLQEGAYSENTLLVTDGTTYKGIQSNSSSALNVYDSAFTSGFELSAVSKAIQYYTWYESNSEWRKQERNYNFFATKTGEIGYAKYWYNEYSISIIKIPVPQTLGLNSSNYIVKFIDDIENAGIIWCVSNLGQVYALKPEPKKNEDGTYTFSWGYEDAILSDFYLPPNIDMLDGYTFGNNLTFVGTHSYGVIEYKSIDEFASKKDINDSNLKSLNTASGTEEINLTSIKEKAYELVIVTEIKNVPNETNPINLTITIPYEFPIVQDTDKLYTSGFYFDASHNAGALYLVNKNRIVLNNSSANGSNLVSSTSTTVYYREKLR